MNILVVSPIASHPPISGARMRINKLVMYLKALGHKIYFLHYNIEDIGGKAKYQMTKEWEKYIEIPKSIEFRHSLDNIYGIDDWYEDKITDKVLNLIETKNIDSVITNYVFMTKFFDFLPDNITKIIDTHDIMSVRLELYIKNDIKPSFYYTSLEEEKKGLNRADIIFAIQDEEAKYFKEHTHKEVVTINHLEDVRYISRNYENLKKIGYLGANNKFNRESIYRFLDEFEKYEKSNMELHIAGNICKEIKTKDERVKLVGFVDKIEDFYGEMDLIINPTVIGTGLKIKSIEALSFGVPIVSTKIGFEGIYSKSDFHNLNNSDELIKQIDLLVNNPSKLYNLSILSKSIFKDYIYKTKLNLFKLFPTELTSINNENYTIESNLNIYEPLMCLLQKLVNIKFLRSPIKKIKAYKNILKEFEKLV